MKDWSVPTVFALASPPPPSATFIFKSTRISKLHDMDSLIPFTTSGALVDCVDSTSTSKVSPFRTATWACSHTPSHPHGASIYHLLTLWNPHSNVMNVLHTEWSLFDAPMFCDLFVRDIIPVLREDARHPPRRQEAPRRSALLWPVWCVVSPSSRSPIPQPPLSQPISFWKTPMSGYTTRTSSQSDITASSSFVAKMWSSWEKSCVLHPLPFPDR